MNSAWKLTLFSVLLATLLAGCPGFGDEEPESDFDGVPEKVNFEEHVSLIMNRYCNQCHAGTPQQGAPGYLRLDTCENVGSTLGAANQASRSLSRMQSAGSPMPPLSVSNPPSDLDIQILERWISCGTPCAASDADICPPSGESSDNNAENNNAPNNNAQNNNAQNNNAGPLNFANAAAPVFERHRCAAAGCHTGSPGAAGLSLDTLESTVGSNTVKACNSAESILMLKLREATLPYPGLMPPGGPEMGQEDFDLLAAWINTGEDVCPQNESNNESESERDNVEASCQDIAECRAACDDGADKVLCTLDCAQAEDTCRQCVVGGLTSCGQANCAETITEEFTSCYQDCQNHPNSVSQCLRDLCAGPWAAFSECVEPLLRDGTCSEGFENCPLE